MEKTQHFVHELLNFMRSPYDMIGFDEAVQYDWPPHLVCRNMMRIERGWQAFPST
jgi:hypothetical protein